MHINADRMNYSWFWDYVYYIGSLTINNNGAPIMETRYKAVLLIILAVIAGSIVYIASPPDWPTTGKIGLTIYTNTGDGIIEAKAFFNISESGNVVVPDSSGGYNVSVDYAAPAKFSPGSKIVVKVLVSRDGENICPEIAGSKIVVKLDDGREYTYHPAKRNGDTLVYEIQPYIHVREAGFIFGSAIVLFAGASVIHYVITGLYVTIALVLVGIQPGKLAFAYYMKPLIMVFIAGSGIELVIRKWGLDKRIARLLSRIARSPYTLVIGVSFLGSFLSMWMSNTAATYVMLPLATALLCNRKLDKCGKFSSIVMVSLAMGASIGGTATLIGTPPNLIAAGFLNDIVYGSEEINFYNWLLIGLPAWIIGYGVGVLLAIIYMRIMASDELPTVYKALRETHEIPSEPMTGKQWLAAAAILFLVAMWITEPIHHVSTGLAAGLGLLVFFASGLLDPKKDWKKLSWDLMVLFGAGLTLGSGLMNTGWADYMLGLLQGVESLGWLSLLIIGFTAYLIGTFISSHTSASAFIAPLTIPLGMLIGPVIGVSPETGAALATIVAVVSLNNAIALPISTPPSAIVYASGGAKLRDLLTYGFIFGVTVNLLIILLLTGYWASIL